MWPKCSHAPETFDNLCVCCVSHKVSPPDYSDDRLLTALDNRDSPNLLVSTVVDVLLSCTGRWGHQLYVLIKEVLSAIPPVWWYAAVTVGGCCLVIEWLHRQSAFWLYTVSKIEFTVTTVNYITIQYCMTCQSYGTAPQLLADVTACFPLPSERRRGE